MENVMILLVTHRFEVNLLPNARNSFLELSAANSRLFLVIQHLKMLAEHRWRMWLLKAVPAWSMVKAMCGARTAPLVDVGLLDMSTF